MELPRTRATLPHVTWLATAESTNAALRNLVVDAAAQGKQLPQGTLVATDEQTAGRGRLGRDWVTPPNTALSASLLVHWSDAGASWLPLLVGSAVAKALQPYFLGVLDEDTGENVSKRVGVKWPNDVHVRGEAEAIAGQPGAKLAGILCEAVADGHIIVGFGLNLLQEDWQLPTDRAGSLRACGAKLPEIDSLQHPAGAALVDQLLATICADILALVAQAKTEPAAARNRVLRDSLTIGSEVRVHLPGGEIVDGRAVALAADGALVIDLPTTGQLVVSAADIEHLR